MVWGGLVGPYLSDWAEQRYGFQPTPQQKAEVEKYIPKITSVDPKTSNGGSSGGSSGGSNGGSYSSS